MIQRHTSTKGGVLLLLTKSTIMKKKLLISGGARQETYCDVFICGESLMFSSKSRKEITSLLFGKFLEGRNAIFLNECYDNYRVSVPMEHNDKILDYETGKPLVKVTFENFFQ